MICDVLVCLPLCAGCAAAGVVVEVRVVVLAAGIAEGRELFAPAVVCVLFPGMGLLAANSSNAFVGMCCPPYRVAAVRFAPPPPLVVFFVVVVVFLAVLVVVGCVLVPALTVPVDFPLLELVDLVLLPLVDLVLVVVAGGVA